jgi:L-fuculose-phosphate aldolase
MSTRPPELLAEREAVALAARRLEDLGLNVGTAGNVGLRVPGGVLVTPSGIPPHAIDPRDVVLLDERGAVAEGERCVPTSEWRIHVDLLAARPDVHAVVHTHSPELTAVACLRRPLPALHYVVGKMGLPEVPCAGYATYGTPELSDSVQVALGPVALAALMANHGMVALGADLTAAVDLAADLEWLAGVYRRALTMGEPVVLPDAEMSHIIDKFQTYGQRR